MEEYKTIQAPATATIMEKKSEFIALAAPACTEQAAVAVLEGVRKAHPSANHHVYAYRLREGARQRYSDDGEPAKTAGLPVLSVLEGAGLLDLALVVTRYFGGTLLGTGGLVRAYTLAAQKAVEAARIQTIRLCVTLSFRLPYPLYQPAQRLLEDAGAAIAAPVFAGDVGLSASLPAGQEAALIQKLGELGRGKLAISLSKPFFVPFG